MIRDPRIFQIDPARTTALRDGWRATVCIGTDGTETCWLVSPAPKELAGCACPACAPHDQLDTPVRTKATKPTEQTT